MVCLHAALATQLILEDLKGLVDQGNITLAARVKDTHIGRGDRIVVSIACRNDSLVDIQRVELKLQEIVAGDVKSSREGNFGEDKTFKENIEHIAGGLGLIQNTPSALA